MADLNLSEQFGLDTLYGSNAERQIIKTVNASAANSVEFAHGVDGVTMDDTFSRYLLEVNNFRPGTDNGHLQVEVSNDAGVSWDTSSNYDWAGDYNNNGVGSGPFGQSNFGYWRWSDGVAIGNATGETFNGSLLFIDPSDTSHYKTVIATIGSWSSSNVVGKSQLTLGYKSVSVINGIKLYMSTGTMATGEFKLIGLK